MRLHGWGDQATRRRHADAGVRELLKVHRRHRHRQAHANQRGHDRGQGGGTHHERRRHRGQGGGGERKTRIAQGTDRAAQRRTRAHQEAPGRVRLTRQAEDVRGDRRAGAGGQVLRRGQAAARKVRGGGRVCGGETRMRRSHDGGGGEAARGVRRCGDGRGGATEEEARDAREPERRRRDTERG